MKVDKSNPWHWLWLLQFGLCVLGAWALRPFRRPGAERVIVLYGHKLSGNLLAIHEAMRQPGAGFRPVFLTMDPAYHAALLAQGVDACRAGSMASMRLLATARAVVSDHGLHSLVWMLGRSSLKFFDVWHGIPFKGFDADDFRVQRRYDEAWVASPLHRDLYLQRFGFEPGRVHITGYARTDALVRPCESRQHLLAKFGLEAWAGKRFVLFAPTWKQDASERSLFPFELAEQAFLEQLGQACDEHDAIVLVRRHLNSGAGGSPGPENVVYLPFADHPDTEAILRLSDILICDWSSIAFDYLLLDRPTIFLEVPPPFRKGFSLGPEYRHGAIVGGMDAMLGCVRRFLADPESYRAEVRDRPAQILSQVYGGLPDGHASERCLERLRQHIAV